MGAPRKFRRPLRLSPAVSGMLTWASAKASATTLQGAPTAPVVAVQVRAAALRGLRVTAAAMTVPWTATFRTATQVSAIVPAIVPAIAVRGAPAVPVRTAGAGLMLPVRTARFGAMLPVRKARFGARPAVMAVRAGRLVPWMAVRVSLAARVTAAWVSRAGRAMTAQDQRGAALAHAPLLPAASATG